MGDLTFAFERDDSRPNHPCFTWSVIGPDGGVHIWAQYHDDEWAQRWNERFFGGVECHWPVTDGSADHAECWLLKKPCRHDGTSLYFSERIAPMLSLQNAETSAINEFMQSELADWYRSRIAKEGGAK